MSTSEELQKIVDSIEYGEITKNDLVSKLETIITELEEND